MPLVKLTDLFKFSPDGIRVMEFEPGDHDLEGRALEVAVSLGIVDDSAIRAEAAAAAAAAGAAGKGGAKAKPKAGE